MMVTGIVISGIGGLGLAVGVLTGLATPFACLAKYCWTEDGDEHLETMGAVAGISIAAGAGLAAIGIPLAVIGSRHERRDVATPLAPTVSVGPTGGSLTWRW
ncbi:MAG: hypothetical protein JRI23_29880 [Deltaproteobacteria bacterium]|nr:hypothetical protein [Deltaproteobacteria bacterium]MBW2536361.1 hypothetical protein [Deltaproteobacteria bacterium]